MKLQKSKWFLSVVSIVLVFSFVLSGCGKKDAASGAASSSPSSSTSATSTPTPSNFKVGMVTDVGGVHDNSFNQGAWEGLQQFGKDTNTKVDYAESHSDADYEPNINQFVKSNWDLTWGIGFMMGDAIKKVAGENPKAHLAIIDSVVDAPNVASITFKENEGSFLVGVVAGMMTKTNKIGFVGGMKIPVIKRFEVGFLAGVKAVNPDAKVSINYTGSFTAPDQGKAAAATLFNDGADIVFHAAGQTGDGVFNEAKQRLKDGKKVWVIGVDKDQSVTFGTDVTLTSMVKRVDKAVQMISKQAKDGQFKAGTQELGLKEDGVGLPAENPNIPQNVMDKVKEYQQKIISGEIQVPNGE